jgi:hypothetical protein
MRDTYQNPETGIEIDADFSQSASPIRWRPIDEERWRGTPFQTADARHNPNIAIEIIDEWLEMQG